MSQSKDQVSGNLDPAWYFQHPAHVLKVFHQLGFSDPQEGTVEEVSDYQLGKQGVSWVEG